MEIELIFESGCFLTIDLTMSGLETNENWWEEIACRQSPWDLSDGVTHIRMQGEHGTIRIDNDGEWMAIVEEAIESERRGDYYASKREPK